MLTAKTFSPPISSLFSLFALRKKSVRLTIPFIELLSNKARPIGAFVTLGFFADSDG